ncbi:hypothetical protein [Aureimonas pseudogalii]|uniref:Uncharacterized protein n=1 Tax=Aureimonas pseudogalii TaxID=1744844 RepID=A0A7W6MLU0_9HYPH|nr:hypothetical protein [Aureimonas pseudogalii]MBB4000138.1 hypothetical protein [Aureimonas pseudogalii]
MTYDIYFDIAEHRAELAHCLLTKRERAETLRNLEKLLAEAAAKEAEA